jgi:hypothetical protein
MSDQPTEPRVPGPETQKQRWAKYGSNVALVSVVVVLLGIIGAALAQLPSLKARIDTTEGGLYSLKPQTKGILKDLKENVRVVSLYAQTDPVPGKESDYYDYATPVADLLEEYERHGGGKIDVEVIDPTKDPRKIDDLITHVTERYGGEVKQYRDFVAGYDKSEEEIKKLANAEIAAVVNVDAKELGGSDLGQIVQVAQRQLEDIVRSMEQSAKERKLLLGKKPPDYKGAVDIIRGDMSSLSGLGTEAARLFKAGDPKASETVTKYAAEAAPRYEAIAKQATAVSDQITKLGELKLDNLRQTLTSREGRNSILVMGENDMRVIPFSQVWQDDPNIRRMLTRPDKTIRPQFAGEQQITSAVLGLTQKTKPKVAFVRAGGPPVAAQGMLFMSRAGPLAAVAARLREYNFEVLEKDLTGTWAMQQQMQQRGMPPEPEPDDAEIKDAVWFVIGLQAPQGMMGPPPSIVPKVAEHLKAGGSAVFLCSPQSDDFSAALADFGIKVRTDAVIVHETVPTTGAPGDFINEAQKTPYVFVVNEYGRHMLAEPLRSFDMPLVAGVPVSTEMKTGIKQWNLLPVPNAPPTWAETDVEQLSAGEKDPTFDAAKDQPGPLFAGAAAEKEQGSGRVVVIGTWQFATNELLRMPDRELYEKEGRIALRFPGSLELLTNSVFWLAKMEPMIAISPAAMDVSRIEPMSDAAQAFWRTGVVWVGLPLLVLLAGGLMYVRRRD